MGRKIRTVFISVCVFAAYYFAGKFGLQLGAVGGFASLVWAPAGIGVIALWFFGYRLWPAISMGAVLINWTTGAPFWVCLCIGVGNAFESILAVYLLKRFSLRPTFDQIQNILLFIVCVAFAALFSASIGVSTLVLSGSISVDELQTAWLSWAFGDVMGCLLVAPLGIVWGAERFRLPRFTQISWLRVGEFILASIILIFISIIVFTDWFGAKLFEFPRSYWIFPPMIWLAFRFGQKAATASIFLVACFAIGATVSGRSIFTASSLSESLFRLQMFLLVATITIQCVSAALAERERTEKALRESELQLRQRTRDLERSNDELEHFASIASHDLKEPLRTISLNLAMFTEAYQNKIDTEGLEYLTMSKDSAVKMQRLIDALRQYSQYGRSHLRITNVNCSGEVERVLKIFENEINSSQAVIEVGHLPEVRADKNLLGQVFKHLISNALKYRSERLPIIKIEARRDQESWLFQIQDNGIGFSMAFSERAFKIFQRLSSGPNFSGTGIGLALCKKIIEQHGGRIWIDSVEGKGSSFYFTLPV